MVEMLIRVRTFRAELQKMMAKSENTRIAGFIHPLKQTKI